MNTPVKSLVLCHRIVLTVGRLIPPFLAVALDGPLKKKYNV